MIFKPLFMRAGQIEQQQAGDGLKVNLGASGPVRDRWWIGHNNRIVPPS